MKNILVISVNWIGDAVFSTPVFRALKQQYPHVRISCLAVPRVRELLECCPDIDEIITYDERGRHRSLAGKWTMICELRRRRFEAAFLLRHSWSRAGLIFLAGIPIRVGYSGRSRGSLLTTRVNPSSENCHRSDEYLAVIEQFGIPVVDRRCGLVVPQEARKEMECLLASRGIRSPEPFVVVHVGGNWDLKRWPRQHFSELIRRLHGELSLKVVIPGADSDAGLAQEIAADSSVRPVVLAGQTSLKGLLAVMARASLVISNDSGPLHMASAVGTPVIGIFGPTRPEVTGPRGMGGARLVQHDVGCNVTPCYYLACPSNVCMQAVSVGEVLAVVRELVGREERT